MINQQILQKLKQTNVSVDTQKTKTRVYELWGSANREQKNNIEEMAGISRASLYRVYTKGSISAKVAVPMAKYFNVDPRYLTGEVDEAGECSDSIIVKFLSNLEYADSLKPELDREKRRIARENSSSKKTKRTNIKGTNVGKLSADSINSSSDDSSAGSVDYVSSVATITTPSIDASDLTLADLHLLMQSLLLREKAGITEAVAKAAALRALLLS